MQEAKIATTPTKFNSKHECFAQAVYRNQALLKVNIELFIRPRVSYW